VIGTAVIRDGVEIGDATPNAIYPWWSFTKTVQAAAVFKLAEQGKLDLDAPLEGKSYTLRQCLSHRSGLTDYGGLAEYHAAVARGDQPWPFEEILKRTRADTLLFAPGQRWSYSNIGYTFVRQAIERATDSELRSALHATIFAPLGVHASLTRRRSDMQRCAFTNVRNYDPNWVYHGLILGTAMDATRLLHRLFTTNYLSQASRDAMMDALPVSPQQSAGRPFKNPMMATGLMFDPDGPLGPWFGHTGGGPGSGSAIYHFPERNLTAAAFSDETEDSGAIERLVLELAGA